MKFFQKEIRLPAANRGYHLITDKVVEALPELKRIEVGMLHVFIKHTSASLTINENADYTVRGDFERHMNVMVPENAPYYEHVFEGADDMPAHIKAAMLPVSLSIPVMNGRLRLGIMAYLSTVSPAIFGELKDKVGATDGNLSTHLRKLEDAGYVRQEKRFVGRRPQTRVFLTDAGRKAWLIWIDRMQGLMRAAE